MSKSATQSVSKTCCAWKVAAALLVLRLCVGWHFFAEGIKKVSYDQGRDQWSITVPTEYLLGQAVGPLADVFHGLVPGDHNWRGSLAVPQQLTPESSEQLANWVARYVKRRQTEIKKQQPTEVEVPEFLPYAAWYEEISRSRRGQLDAFVRIPELTADQKESAAAVYESHDRQLADYLAEQSLDIQTYQHELWRLENLRQQTGGTTIPFQGERIAKKNAETGSEPRQWVASVKAFDQDFAADLRALLTSEQLSSGTNAAADQALTTPEAKNLHRMNLAVTCLTLGVGVCLLAGLFTRLASVAGAAFLLTVMATQPPWVAGAQTTYFYYQLVELAALLFLAASAAGRVAGLDFVLHGMWTRCCGTKHS